LLEAHGVDYRYREYTEQPLSTTELERLLKLLGVEPRALLRKNDRAYKELGLTGAETTKKLVKLMAEHPTLLQRPIAVSGDRAVVGRPVDNILALIS
jgi:arsenate reductase (glutaredoxin)